jgi:tetratricopeptide (TPR) repeat protein
MAVKSDGHFLALTDGDIATVNLESARRHSWAQFRRDPQRPGLAEAILDHERLAAQFLGDIDAFERMETLVGQLPSIENAARAELISADVASAVHRFEDARKHLVSAASTGAPANEVEQRILTIDQGCGARLEHVLVKRTEIAKTTGRLEDLVPLGALLADLECFEESDAVYRKAFTSYDGVSPFPLAWVSFQLGMLWGEQVPEPELHRAAFWYRRAIACVPRYVRARVHLAEICAKQEQTFAAEALLLPALSSEDPEVQWRLADVLFAQARFEEAEIYLAAAQARFEKLLRKYPLAFADHAAEFYAGSGDSWGRALELAQVNATNRPTRRALEQVQTIATLS